MWPHERSLVERLAGKPFAMLGVNVNGAQPVELAQWMQEHGMTWRSFADPPRLLQGPIVKAWNVSTTPTLYVLDARGVIRRRWLGDPGPETIDAVIDALVAEAER